MRLSIIVRRRVALRHRRRRGFDVVRGDRAYQLRGIVSLGIKSGHFFEPASVQRDYQGQLDVPVTNLKGLVTSS